MALLAIRDLTLSHFRSHKAAHLTPDPRPLAIHGANGAGKTNILEAISMLSPGRGLRRAAIEDMARAPEALGWKVRAVVESLSEMHEIEVWAEGPARQVRIDGKAASQVALGRLMRILWLVPSMDRLWLDGAAERRRFLDRMAMSFEPGHAELAITYEKAMRERNRLLKDQVRDTGWYDALEAQMALAGGKLTANRLATIDRLATAQEGAETAFPTADLALVSGDDQDADLDGTALRDALAGGRGRDMAAGRTLTGPHRADLAGVYAAKGVEAKLCSTGEQKALLVSLILANARALAEDFGAPPVLLLDEVAAHLDENRRAALYDEICALGAQAWMTGTGPELFTSLGDRAQWLEVTEAGGVSAIVAK